MHRVPAMQPAKILKDVSLQNIVHDPEVRIRPANGYRLEHEEHAPRVVAVTIVIATDVLDQIVAVNQSAEYGFDTGAFDVLIS
jgi:hypothetical protein